MNWLQRLLCKHNRAHWIRNIYGDEIRERGGHRSLWQCLDCERIFTKPDLGDCD